MIQMNNKTETESPVGAWVKDELEAQLEVLAGTCPTSCLDKTPS